MNDGLLSAEGSFWRCAVAEQCTRNAALGVPAGALGCRSAGQVRQPKRRRKTWGGSTLDGSFFGSLVGMSVRLRNFADQSERNRPIPMSKPARISTLRRFVVALAFVACSLALGPRPALAWGDEGHEIIALVAEQFLDPAVGKRSPPCSPPTPTI
jgi:hypothetical protein